MYLQTRFKLKVASIKMNLLEVRDIHKHLHRMETVW